MNGTEPNYYYNGKMNTINQVLKFTVESVLVHIYRTSPKVKGTSSFECSELAFVFFLHLYLRI